MAERGSSRRFFSCGLKMTEKICLSVDFNQVDIKDKVVFYMYNYGQICLITI